MELLIRGEPVGPFQQLYLIKENEPMEVMNVRYSDLIKTIFSLIDKCNISIINLSGSRFYMEGIEEQIKTANTTIYNNHSLTFEYV